ncbi:hypothetical protein ACFQX6_27460 [Streptosporangium lutulentum]
MEAAVPACRQCLPLVLDAAGGSPPQWAPGARVSVTYPGYKIGELAGVGLASYTGDEAEAHFAELTRALGGCPVVASHRRASRAPPSRSPTWTWKGSAATCRPGG